MPATTEIKDVTATNTKPHVVDSGSVQPEYQQIGTGYDYALMLPFNVPVQPEKSWILPEPTGYQTEWIDGFPVTQDGTTEISFYDIFGTLYTQELVLDVGTVLEGEDAVECGLIDSLGSLSDALEALYDMIEKDAGEAGKAKKSGKKKKSK